MKFKNLDELIDFEKNLQWFKEDEIKIGDYRLSQQLKNKYNQLKGNKKIGLHNNKIVSIVSDEFNPISVQEIANSCDKVFGEKFEEKSYKQGIVRIYNQGVEDRIGEVKPIVIYPANLGTMAVNIGIHHNATICSNGLFISDHFLTRRIIHRLGERNIEQLATYVSNNLGTVLKSITQAKNKKICDYLQLALIIQGLSKNDRLVSKALNKYTPQENTLWETIQSITYVVRDEKRNGYQYQKKAGTFLLKPTLERYQLLDAANYLFHKEQQGKIVLANAGQLYSEGIKILGGVM